VRERGEPREAARDHLVVGPGVARLHRVLARMEADKTRLFRGG